MSDRDGVYRNLDYKAKIAWPNCGCEDMHPRHYFLCRRPLQSFPEYLCLSDLNARKKYMLKQLKKYPNLRPVRKDNIQELRDEAEIYKRQHEEMSRMVNKQALLNYEEQELQYKDLLRRRDKVKEDKEQIQEVIKTLDEKKHEQIQTTYKK